MKRSLAKSKGELVAALDIGSTKTCCFVARVGDARSPGAQGALSGVRILGIGHQVAGGVRNGAVIDMDAAETAIRRAVHAAETMAKETVTRVFVNLSGGYPMSRTFGVEVAIDGHEVADGDLRRILGHGRSVEIEDDRDLIHSIPVGFSIDGNRGIRDPRGMAGQKLGAHIHLVTAASGPVRNLSMVVQRCHLDIDGYVASPYASGLSCLVEDEMDLGVTVIDMGGGTTTVAVFFDGSVVFTDVVPVGGGHVTNDIARGLSTPIAEAERLKTLHGCATLSPLDDRETLEVPQVGEEADAQPNQVQKSMLIRIIQPRLEEIFEMVKARLEQSGFDKIAGRRAVLTGGASQMPGLRDLAQRILDKQVRLGRPIRINGLADAATGPAFSTCAGLLAYAVDPGFDVPEIGRADKVEPAGMLGKVGSWLRENF
ncbi:MAG: cell division protein FtsA [Alphaproteobacteria bacterium]|nr:cell division protein FtsA [Alphaproteobacteria bacterium]